MRYELGILYYNLRCNNYQNAIEEAENFLLKCTEKSENHGKISFWKACSSGFGGLYQNAIKELERVRSSHRYLEYAIVSALIWFHQKADFVDEEELQKLNIALDAAQRCMHVDGVLLSADFYLHANDYEAVSRCLNHRVVKKNKNSDEKAKMERCRIRLWSNIMSGSINTNDFMTFNSVLDHNNHCSVNIDSMMVQAK